MVASVRRWKEQCNYDVSCLKHAEFAIYHNNKYTTGLYCHPHAIRRARDLDTDEMYREILKTSLGPLFKEPQLALPANST